MLMEPKGPLLTDLRVQALLEQIEALRELSEPGEMSSLYQELGKRVHAVWRGDPESFGTDGLTWRPVWEDLPEEDDLTEIPDPSSYGQRTPDIEPAPEAVVRLDELQAQRVKGPLAVGRGSTLSWREPLDELLDLIALPNLQDPNAMPAEATTVQWASGELSGRITRFPDPVQQALLGLLAARARNLASQLDVDIGPRMALDRLKRLRASQDLPWVSALLPNARPETRTWADDARAYWEVLGR